MTSLKHILALNIKEKRRSLGFSQAKLAEKAGAAPTYIAMLELERRSPSIDMIEQIARALEIDPLELFSTALLPIESVKEFHTAVLTGFKEVLENKIIEFNQELYEDARIKESSVSMVAEKINFYST